MKDTNKDNSLVNHRLKVIKIINKRLDFLLLVLYSVYTGKGEKGDVSMEVIIIVIAVILLLRWMTNDF